MKRILRFSYLLTTLVLCSCSGKTDSLKGYNLKGNVSSIDIKSYRAKSKFGQVEKGRLLDSYEGLCCNLVFENRYLKEETIFDSDGDIEKKNIYKYDEDNQLLRIDGYKGDGSLEEKTTYKWENGNLLEIRRSDSEDKEEFRLVREYDGGKNPIRIIQYYDGEKKYVSTNTFKGDKLVSCEQIDEEGNKRTHEYKYDGNLCIEVNIYHPVKMKYDDKGNPIEIVGGEFSPMNYWSTWESAKDEVHYYEYKYDDKGNWIERIDYKGEGKNPETIIEREITYM